MVFRIGDAVVHPIRGAGVVERVEERQWRGNKAEYYRIKLLSHPETSLMVPVEIAQKLGLRRAIQQSQLNQVWHVLLADPKRLPTDHKKRYQLLMDKLHAGDVLQIAEALRDVAWRRQKKGNLTTRGKQVYEEGMSLLAGELAATQGIELSDAEHQIRAKLNEGLSPANP